MKFLVKSLIYLLICLTLLVLGLFYLTLDNQPKLVHKAIMTPYQIARAKKIIKSYDPRSLKNGTVKTIVLQQQDLNLTINYITNQYLGGIANIILLPETATLLATYPIWGDTPRSYINIKIVLRQSSKLPVITALKIGKLSLPESIAKHLTTYVVTKIQANIQSQLILQAVKQVKFEHKLLKLTYQWHSSIPKKLSSALIAPEEQKRVIFYQNYLSSITRRQSRYIPLTKITQPMFILAKKRSIENDPIAENRAVILTLAFYSTKRSLSKFLTEPESVTTASWRNLLLNKRNDLSKHYMVSAMLSAYAGTPLADAIGIYKEIEDSRSGSGFSFNDIAADRSGSKMGKLAVKNQTSAKKLQALMISAVDKDIIPKTSDLPEFLKESDFIRQFGGINGQRYKSMMQEIDRRIEALPISQF